MSIDLLSPVLSHSSDRTALVELVAGVLALLSPFLGIPVVIGYVVGRRIGRPVAAGIVSGLLGLCLFWSSLVIAISLTFENGQGAGVAVLMAAIFTVAFFASPIYAVLGVIVWWLNRRRENRQIREAGTRIGPVLSGKVPAHERLFAWARSHLGEAVRPDVADSHRGDDI